MSFVLLQMLLCRGEVCNFIIKYFNMQIFIAVWMLICSNNVNTVFVPLSKHSNCAFKPRWKDHIYDMNAHECHHHVTGFESTFFYSFFPWGFFFNSLVLQGMNQPNQLRNYEILFEAKKYLRCFMEVDAPSKLFCPDFYLFIFALEFSVQHHG